MNETPAVKVFVDKKSVYRAELVKTLLVEFAKKTGKSVKISQPKKAHPVRPYKGEKFEQCIYLFATPTYLGIVNVDAPYSCNSRGGMATIRIPRVFSYKARRIVDFEGHEVALIVGNTLYVLCRYYEDGEKVQMEVLKHILDDYTLYLQHKILFGREMRRRLGSFTQEQFFDIVSADVKETRLEMISELFDSIDDEMSDLGRTERRRVIVKINDSEEDGLKHKEEFFELYDRLCQLSSGEKITVNSKENEITVPVGQIDIEYKGKVYDIGRFSIKVNLNHCYIRFRNLTRSVGLHYHPSIGRHSEKCYFGDASGGIALLLGQMKLDLVVKMAIEALKTYDPADHFYDIENWPEKQTSETAD